MGTADGFVVVLWFHSFGDGRFLVLLVYFSGGCALVGALSQGPGQRVFAEQLTILSYMTKSKRLLDARCEGAAQRGAEEIRPVR